MFINFFHYSFSKIFYQAFTGEAIPQFLIWHIVPIPILVLAGLGIWWVFKEKMWLANILLMGIAYWALYSFITYRFFISYERLVPLVAILITITAGFGLSYLIRILKDTRFFQKNNALKFIQIGILILFLILSFQYTTRVDWQKLKLVYPESGKTISPAAPANNYLHPDDLKLFKDIKHKTFLSLPWKGTVIGVATQNFPKSTKPGTITLNGSLFYKFARAGCAQKEEITRTYQINYIYSHKFDCPNFEFIDKSKEGLYLYKVNL